MTHQEKMTALEELFEVEAGTITPETSLDSLQWDSMSTLSLIALISESFGKRVSGIQLKELRTIGDILEIMS